MRIVEILKIEENNQQEVSLFKEGLFWRAYEHSAFLFTQHIKKYSLTRKYYKNVSQYVVYLGFPQKILEEVIHICRQKGLKVNEKVEKITIAGFAKIDKAVFSEWKNDIAAFSRPLPVNEKENEIIQKIRNYAVAHKTPIECQQFLSELQNLING